MRVIINDKRYGALKTLGERKQAFNEVNLSIALCLPVYLCLPNLSIHASSMAIKSLSNC